MKSPPLDCSREMYLLTMFRCKSMLCTLELNTFGLKPEPFSFFHQVVNMPNAYLKNFAWLQFVYLTTYAIMSAMALVLVAYLRHNRATALKGDVNANFKIILPAFESLLWVTAAVTGAFALMFAVIAAASIQVPMSARWFQELLPQGRQCCAFLTTCMLLERSLTPRALAHASLFALLLAAVPVVLAYVCDALSLAKPAGFAIQCLVRSCYVLWFVYLFIWPLSRASITTQRQFYAFLLLFYMGVFTYKALFYMGNIDQATYVIFFTAAHDSFTPFFIWRLLRADTDYWRGLSDHAIELQQKLQDTQAMHEIVSAQGLHVLLEVHRKDLIDFAHLQLMRPLATGASARIYVGKLHATTPVAIKVYSPSEISESTIMSFSQEAAVCATLKHPNIVYFHGMCVCPPTICLVYELCRGNLDDALRKASRHTYTEPLWLQLCYMLDAARAVAYLHSFSPPFIHRDIKPANFLLDATNVVKLTDFGESRSMAEDMTHIDLEERTMTVRGSVEYMAPEVIDGKQGQATYTETADIYSLAITLWDILHPGREKYLASNRNHLIVFQMVLDGQRPPIDPEIHPALHDLLENMWNADPVFRPSAKMVVAVLRDLHEDLCGQVAYRLAGSLTYEASSKSNLTVGSRDVSGDELVRCLVDHQYAVESEEAIRLGNSLMDAGCLHHTKHNRAFERQTSYMFASHAGEAVPVHKTPHPAAVLLLEDSMDKPSDMSVLGDTDKQSCRCRKLGQGHAKPKLPRKKMFARQKDMIPHALAVNLLGESGPPGEYYTDFATSSSHITMMLGTARSGD
ncbi:Aste57867_16478 [Aphanomyces stellatus]|uniref:Aste57867_16478 protein n=1 Tax=Aphanomyces stellatus TaxID=120398 RepID=A0A485L6S8_9STRA|nr:hypothetical protein As57867_016421 [Aphanomyces stellatus]VFT93252.1 Aste57867_16478 [Aphanomyces stellatus]